MVRVSGSCVKHGPLVHVATRARVIFPSRFLLLQTNTDTKKDRRERYPSGDVATIYRVSVDLTKRIIGKGVKPFREKNMYCTAGH